MKKIVTIIVGLAILVGVSASSARADAAADVIKSIRAAKTDREKAVKLVEKMVQTGKITEVYKEDNCLYIHFEKQTWSRLSHVNKLMLGATFRVAFPAIECIHVRDDYPGNLIMTILDEHIEYY